MPEKRQVVSPSGPETRFTADPEAEPRSFTPLTASAVPQPVPEPPPPTSRGPQRPAEPSRWLPVEIFDPGSLFWGRRSIGAYYTAGGLATLTFQNQWPPENPGGGEAEQLASIRAEVARLASTDVAVQTFQRLQALTAALNASRADALERLTDLDRQQSELLQEPPSCLDDLQKELDKIGKQSEPLRRTLALLDARSKAVAVEMATARFQAGDALREICRFVVYGKQDALRGERDGILLRIADQHQADLVRLHQIHFQLLGGTDRYNFVTDLETIPEAAAPPEQENAP